MKIHIPNNCGNSPRSLVAIEVAVNMAAREYPKIEQFLTEDFSWVAAGSDKALSRLELNTSMDKATQSNITTERLDIITSISHGKYAAVSSRAHMSNGVTLNSHDLYEFTSAGSSAKLLKVMSYVVDSTHSHASNLKS